MAGDRYARFQVNCMTATMYIPAGRTSKVERRQVSLHVQTEYAGRPMPRITTTILNGGRVVHKIERNLDKPIESPEEQARVEWSIKRQHAEIIEIIRDESKNLAIQVGTSSGPRSENLTIYDRLRAIVGVQRVYRVDNEGNVVGSSSSVQFKRAFGAVFKNIHDLIEIFMRIPGADFSREKGVYEIERDRLYLVSSGRECYFIVVNCVDERIDFEKAIKEAIS